MAAGSVLALAATHYRARQRLARNTSEEAQRVWGQVDWGRPLTSWRNLVPVLTGVVVAAQLRAAAQGAAYAADAAQTAGADPDPAGTVQPAALAGVASDGRTLDGLLLAPGFEAYRRQTEGRDPYEAWLAGLAVLTRIIGTQVADAGRVATGLGVIADRSLAGYERRIRLPSCSRCIIQQGKRFRTNIGFLRHPRCDCVHLPLTADEWYDSDPPDPMDVFHQLSQEEQDRVFTKTGAEAIRDGADIGRVVNARRGMSTASVATPGGVQHLQITLEGAGRGLGRTSHVAGSVRLMPEAIYQLAENRTHAIDLLRRHGYLT